MRNSTVLYGVALMAERLVSFFLLPILAKAISPAEYAVWAQSVVTAGVLTPMALMGFQTAVVKFFPKWDTSPKVRDSVLLAMLASILVLLTAIYMVVTPFAEGAAGFVYGQTGLVAYIPLLAGLLISEALYEFLVGLLRVADRMGLIALYTLLKGVWRIGIFLLVLYGGYGDFYLAFLAFVMVQLLFVMVMYAKDVPVGRVLRAGLAEGRPQWGNILSFSLPLVALAGITGLNNFTDRFFLAHLRSLEEVAAYATVYSLAAVAAFFYSVLGFTLFPAMARCWAQGRRDEAAALVSRVMLVYLTFLLPFIAVLAVAGQNILRALTTDAYAASPLVFLLLACNIGLFGMYQIGFYVVLLAKGSAQTLGLMGATAGVNVLLNYLLVPGLGMTGAALAGFMSNVLLAGVTLYTARRVLDWRFPWTNCAGIVLRTGAVAVFVWGFLPQHTDGSVLNLLLVLSLAAALYLGLDLFDRRSSLINLLKSR